MVGQRTGANREKGNTKGVQVKQPVSSSLNPGVNKENISSGSKVDSPVIGMLFSTVASSSVKKTGGNKPVGVKSKKYVAKAMNGKGKGICKEFSQALGASSSGLQKKVELDGEVDLSGVFNGLEGNSALSSEKSSGEAMVDVDPVQEPEPPDQIMSDSLKLLADSAGMEVALPLKEQLTNSVYEPICDADLFENQSYMGAAKKQFKSTFSRFRKKYKVGMAVILEPRLKHKVLQEVSGLFGFPALFFQRNWEILKDQVLTSMRGYLDKPQLIQEINYTMLALIPKIERPCLMKQFRPIALCNSIYKGLSKILANKIKPLLGSLISPNQVSFVPRRQIQDNIIIAQELVHAMHKMKGRKSFLSIKIDLEKAYDKLNWRFIRSVLDEVKLPGDLVEAIMGCVTSTHLEVLWNGGRTTGFSPQRGIRQGDPISPYLFVLCMEKLTHLIMDEVEAKHWRPIKAGKSGPYISHLMFADDVILFAEASLSQLESITHCLEKFSKMSGQCVSVEKSCIYFSRNAPQEVVDSVTSISGFKKVSNLGCYLGSLMKHGRVRRDHYADAITRFQGRLQGWKSKCLSLEIERLQRNFIWGDSETKKKTHYVSWEQICQSRECGGLGIMNLRRQNEAFMQKLAWQVMTDHDRLWVKVLLGKYGRNANPSRCLISRTSDSPLWKHICRGHNDLYQHLEWKIGNGKEIYFWSDVWGGWKRSLYDLAAHKPPDSQLSFKVSDYVDQVMGDWRWSCLIMWLDANTINKLKNIRTPAIDGPNDSLNWIWSSPSKSFVRNAYCHFPESCERDRVWAAIWKWRGPYRVAVFLWLACLNKIHVRAMTGQWYGGESMCPACKIHPETVMHVLRDCRVARQVWERWFSNNIPKTFLAVEGRERFKINLFHPFVSKLWGSWKEVFFVTCWFLWQWRNSTVHEVLFSLPQDPVHAILIFLDGRKRSANLDVSAAGADGISLVGNSGQQIDEYQVKIFVDGACKLASNIGSSGGFLCSSIGEWKGGFSYNIGNCSSLEAELWGIYHGCKLASDMQYSKVWIGCDSKEALLCLEENDEVCGFSYLIGKIREVALAFEKFQLEFVPRESNSCADYLAKLGFSLKGEELRLHSSPPDDMLKFWLEFSSILLMEHVCLYLQRLTV
ncbi:uncharacterized protein LOC133286473 [Gastrolobium bilobum]|uniref:uncharacterized protein LOC133286473 n=1 Tax=Gastrolobium bilobum TaxID=150636 RepID=UPI002AB11282|nr:uncharacterized protein LOC133286473 [Gastrolobium bilobum]